MDYFRCSNIGYYERLTMCSYFVSICLVNVYTSMISIDIQIIHVFKMMDWFIYFLSTTYLTAGLLYVGKGSNQTYTSLLVYCVWERVKTRHIPHCRFTVCVKGLKPDTSLQVYCMWERAKTRPIPHCWFTVCGKGLKQDIYLTAGLLYV